MSRRKVMYGNRDWFDSVHSEVRVRREPMNVNVIYPQMAPCPPGYKYRPKRKPGQRKCTKETVKSVLSFLQMLAVQNRVSIFKPRKDKKGYTRTLLNVPQLKSRLTRHGISYKIKNNTSNFGMDGSQTRIPVSAELSGAGREALDRLRQNRTLAVNNTAISYYHWLRNRNNRTRDRVIDMLVLLLIERLRTLPISDNPGRDAVNEMLEAYREDASLVYNREDEFIAGMGPVDNSYFYREMGNVYDRIEHFYNRQSGGRGETGRGGSGDIESTESTEGFRGRDIEFEFPRITSGRLPRLEMLRYMRNANPRDSTPTGDNDENYPTGSTEFGRRNKMKANMNKYKYKFGMEQQNPPWRDSQEPPFYGMSEADYNEVQAMIRSRPQRPRVRLPPLTPQQLASRAERWERRAEQLEERGESSEGYSEIQNGIRVALPSWREILEARRARDQPYQKAIQDAMTRYLQSNPPGAGAAFGVLQPRRNISDSRNVRRDFEDARSEMENLHRRRARERMRREIAGDIIFPERPWHGAAPPYATTIQRYARGMNARKQNTN